MKTITIFGKKYRWNYEDTTWYKALCWGALLSGGLLVCAWLWIMTCGLIAIGTPA